MKRLLNFLLAGLCTWTLAGCFHINVMGRGVPDSEYKELWDKEIAREKSGLKPEGAHDEHERVPSWNEFWYFSAGPGAVATDSQFQRMKRYILKQRRAAGLPELTAVRD